MRKEEIERLIAMSKARRAAQEHARDQYSYIVGSNSEQKTEREYTFKPNVGNNEPVSASFATPLLAAVLGLVALGFIHTQTLSAPKASFGTNSNLSIVEPSLISSISNGLGSFFDSYIRPENYVPINFAVGQQKTILDAEYVSEGSSSHIAIDQYGVSLDFQDVKEKPSEVSIYVNPSSNNKDIRTNVVYVEPGISFEQTKVNLQKKFSDKVNAIVTCSDTDYNKETGDCLKPWQIAAAIPKDQGVSVSFTTTHFSAVAGAYLNIIDKVNDETVGITWEEHFQTYGTSTLTIKTVDGAHFGTDLGFQGIYCGDKEQSVQRPDTDTYIVENYSCDNQVSSINNLEQTGGIHWLSFTFGDTVDSKVHNFACNTGTLADTCTVTATNTMNNGDTISGAGSLVLGNLGILTSAAGNSFTINMTGSVTIQSGGSITGNVTITAASVDVQSGGSINLNGLGSAGGATPSASGSGTGGGTSGSGTGGGGSYGGSGSNGSAGGTGSSYGSVTQPISLGSGGACSSVSGCAGGNGGGALKITTTGTTSINGAISANGTNGNANGATGGGSGGSVWITADTISGTSAITANGGNPGQATGGAGGGGRIAFYYTTSFTHSGTESAYGGSTSNLPGGAGTIFKKAASASNGDLIVDNNSYSGTNTTQVAATSLTVDNLTIKNTGFYVIPSGATLTVVNSFTGMTSNSSLTNLGTLGLPLTAAFGSISFTNSGNITLASPSAITGLTSLTLPSASISSGGLTIGTGVTVTISGTSTASLTSLTIQSGGTLTHSTNTTTQANVINLSVSGNVDIQAGGTININGKGFAGGNNTSGSGTGGGGTSFRNGGGAGYGGAGVASGTGAGGIVYGPVTQPSSLGSGGGGAGQGETGGAGGGAVKITATGTVTVNGTISVNGSSGNVDGSGAGGGGSGGSVWLVADTIAGAGAITANGAPGGAGSFVGGPGGGGRIAFYYTTAFTHSGTESAYGGNNSGYTGGAGTIYKKAASATNGDLIVDNNNLTAGNTTQVAATNLTFDNVTIKNSANYVIPSGDTLTVATAFTSGTTNASLTINSGGTLVTAAAMTSSSGAPLINNAGTFTLGAANFTISSSFTNSGSISSGLNLTIGSGGTFTQSGTSSLSLSSLTIQSGGNLTHSANGTSQSNVINLAVSGNVNIQTGATVNVNGNGFAGGNNTSGSGTGGGGTSFRNGGGAGYGGAGVASGSGAGGIVYGLAIQPTSLGSGGGGAGQGETGGAGGGAVKITATGTITVNGTISANGSNGNVDGSGAGGGGSGGSVWLVADTIAGAGAITANGAPGGAGSYVGGPGGGGRIALGYTTSFTYSGTKTTSGGSNSGLNASAGTVNTEASSTNTITAFCTVAGNGCTTAGALLSPQQAYRVNSIAGTATAGSNATIANINISIKDTDPSVNKWYNTSNNSFDQSTENFFASTGTTSWSYNSSAIQWVVGHTYQIRAEAVNTSTLVGPIQTLSFTYNTSPPTVSNVTAAQSGNNVNIGYDVSDPVFSSFTVSLGFNAGITLGADVTSGATSLTVSDATHLPASGSIYIDDEEISYASKSGNTLSGLVRAQNTTTAAAHTSGTIVYIKATTVSGNIGASVTAGTGKTITWTAATDVPSYTSATAKVRVIANNLNSTNQVGSALSSNFAYDTTAPATQTASSVKAVPTSDSEVTVTWTTDKASNSTVDYGTTTSYGVSKTDATMVTSHSVGLTGLAAGTTYYFRVKATDANNNTLVDDNGGLSYSVKTPTVASVQSSIDTTAPTITAVAVSGITSTGVTVTWTTDELANSFVYYGGTTAYGSLAGAPDVFTGAHSVSVSGLTASTTYNYQVVSLDKSGNRAATTNATFTTAASDGTTSGTGSGTTTGTTTQSADYLQDQVNTLQAQLAAQQQQISDLESQLTGALTSNQVAAIKSQLSSLREQLIATNGKLQAAEQALQQAQAAQDKIADLEKRNKDLSDKLDYITNKILGLTDGSKMSPSDLLKVLVAKFSELANNLRNNGTVAEKQQVEDSLGDANTTLKDLTSLVPGPKIGVNPKVEVQSTSATINWTTDKDSNSMVAYGDEASYQGSQTYASQTGDQKTLTQNHSVEITGLIPATTYHYQISSTADSGAQTTSRDFTFTTKTAVATISNANISKLSDTSAEVTWNTSIPTNSAVIYTEVVNGVADTSNSKTVGTPEFSTHHDVKLDGLSQGRSYSIEVSSSDAYNNVVTEKLGTFVTGEDKTPPVITELRPQISIIPDPKQSTIQTIITWKTDEPSTSQVVFSKGSVTGDRFSGQTELNGEYTYSHTVVLTSWDPGALYSFKAVSKDQSGNEAQSKTYTVRTPEQKGNVIDVIIGNFTDVFGWTKKLGK